MPIANCYIARGDQRSPRSTCMPYPRRQRSSWARIEPSERNESEQQKNLFLFLFFKELSYSNFNQKNNHLSKNVKKLKI